MNFSPRKVNPLLIVLTTITTLIVGILVGNIDVLQNLTDNSAEILFKIRLPRVLVGAICGASLAAAGVLAQGLFRNPLASPSIIGTTAGASLATALAFYFTSAHWMVLPLTSSIGALVATLLILHASASKKMFAIENLLLAGFALNTFLSAITSFVVTIVLEDHQKFPAMIYWLLGGLSAKSWEHFKIGVIGSMLGIFCAYRIIRQLNVLVLGEEIASTLAINVAALRFKTIATIALLVGTTVSIAGPISFVGLIVPHITRYLIGPEHRRLLTYSILNGVTLVVGADVIAKTIRDPVEVQVGVLIAIVGSPFFIWLLFSKSKARGETT